MRRAVTLLELVVVVAIVGVLCAIGVPSLLRHLDRTRVRHAADEIAATLSLARATAIARERRVTTVFDSTRASLLVILGTDTLVARDLRAAYGVGLRSNRDSAVYGPGGLGVGAANQTIVIRRRDAADTVVISRLGRVRH